MHASQLAGQLQGWAAEFCSISGDQVTVPDRLWAFLASRLAELGFAEDDPDVVSVRIGESYRKVRITGTQGDRLCYKHIGGTRGMGLVPVRDVHDDDRGKLTDILEALAADGRIPSA